METVIASSSAQSLLGDVLLTENDRGVGCDWCPPGSGTVAYLVDDAGIENGVCVRHVRKHFPGLLSEDVRPAEHAKTFRMLMVVSGRSDAVVGKWESYPDFQSLFRASRELTGGRAIGRRFTDDYSSERNHYLRTGHHRMVFRREDHNGRETRTHVVIHVLVK